MTARLDTKAHAVQAALAEAWEIAADLIDDGSDVPRRNAITSAGAKVGRALVEAVHELQSLVAVGLMMQQTVEDFDAMSVEDVSAASNDALRLRLHLISNLVHESVQLSLRLRREAIGDGEVASAVSDVVPAGIADADVESNADATDDGDGQGSGENDGESDGESDGHDGVDHFTGAGLPQAAGGR